MFSAVTRDGYKPIEYFSFGSIWIPDSYRRVAFQGCSQVSYAAYRRGAQ
jgi:hypothetical protein